MAPLLPNFILLMNESPIEHRILIVGDFNLDQMLPENVANIAPLIQSVDLSERSQYSSDMHGEILDLAFDSSNSNIVSVLPSPCSDHFVFFPNLRARYDFHLHCQHYPHNTAHYYNFAHFKCLVEIELVKNSENRKFSFFSVYACCVAFINRLKSNYRQNDSSKV